MLLMRFRFEISPNNLLPDKTQRVPLKKLLKFITEDEASGSTISATISPVSATSQLIYSAVPFSDLQGELITDTNIPIPGQMEDFVSCYTNPTPQSNETLESILSNPNRQLQYQLLENDLT